MDKFKIETSFQFPFFKLNELVSYEEVKKPSGVAYMLLVLLNESNSNLILSNVLENFGVPRSLHYIYADTISNLINQDILSMKNGVQFFRSEFSALSIGDIEFTKKGKKIFSEESIPTGITKEAKIPVFYDIALKQLSLSMSGGLEPKPLMDSAITEGFMQKFSCEKDVEDFINQNKGNRIPIYENGKVIKNELIKKEEVITKVEEITKENWTGKYDVTIVVENNKLSFDFENKVVEKFFYENYSSEMINKAIEYKNRFKFKSIYKDGLDITNYKTFDIHSILIPKDIDDLLKQKGQLFISRGNYHNNNILSIESTNSLDNFDGSCEFVIVDQADNAFGYIPGIFNFKSDLGQIHIPLVLKIKLSKENLEKILSTYISGLTSYSEDNFKLLVKLSSISKDYELAYKVFNGYLKGKPEDNISLLNEMKPFALLNGNILDEYKKALLTNYEKYLSNVSEDNLETFLKITNNIPKFLNLSAKEVLTKLFDNLKNIKDSQLVYEALVNANFDKSMVVLYINPAKEVLESKDAREKSLLDLINFDNSLSKLKDLSNINDYKNYVFDEESINRKEFKTLYSLAKDLRKSIDFFAPVNVELFSEYDNFLNIFGTINDDFNMLDAALNNPNNIKLELIEKKIISGDYQFVFVNLSAKLELILRNNYKLEGKLSDMLSEARRTGKINRDIISDLHDFRENRNAYIHPEDRTPNFKPEDLRRWANEIFELEEVSK